MYRKRTEFRGNDVSFRNSYHRPIERLHSIVLHTLIFKIYQCDLSLAKARTSCVHVANTTQGPCKTFLLVAVVFNSQDNVQNRLTSSLRVDCLHAERLYFTFASSSSITIRMDLTQPYSRSHHRDHGQINSCPTSISQSMQCKQIDY